MNCWVMMRCPREVYKTCPAYLKRRGRDCWKVTGTKCDQGRLEMATLAEKIAFCRKCRYYQTYASKF